MDKINKSIGCNVHECKYHAGDKQYCTLDDIMVTHHTEPARTKENTDCGSFEARQ